VLVLLRIGSIIFPIVPDGKGHVVEQVAQLLARQEGSLGFRRNAPLETRVTPLPAQDRNLIRFVGGSITLSSVSSVPAFYK
jgi:hypothetical protein